MTCNLLTTLSCSIARPIGISKNILPSSFRNGPSCECGKQPSILGFRRLQNVRMHNGPSPSFPLLALQDPANCNVWASTFGKGMSCARLLILQVPIVIVMSMQSIDTAYRYSKVCSDVELHDNFCLPTLKVVAPNSSDKPTHGLYNWGTSHAFAYWPRSSHDARWQDMPSDEHIRKPNMLHCCIYSTRTPSSLIRSISSIHNSHRKTPATSRLFIHQSAMASTGEAQMRGKNVAPKKYALPQPTDSEPEDDGKNVQRWAADVDGAQEESEGESDAQPTDRMPPKQERQRKYEGYEGSLFRGDKLLTGAPPSQTKRRDRKDTGGIETRFESSTGAPSRPIHALDFLDKDEGASDQEFAPQRSTKSRRPQQYCEDGGFEEPEYARGLRGHDQPLRARDYDDFRNPRIDEERDRGYDLRDRRQPSSSGSSRESRSYGGQSTTSGTSRSSNTSIDPIHDRHGRAWLRASDGKTKKPAASDEARRAPRDDRSTRSANKIADTTSKVTSGGATGARREKGQMQFTRPSKSKSKEESSSSKSGKKKTGLFGF